MAPCTVRRNSRKQFRAFRRHHPSFSLCRRGTLGYPLKRLFCLTKRLTGYRDIGDISYNSYLYYWLLHYCDITLKGYSTIQIRESLQKKLKEAYELRKVDLFAKQDVKSYTAYAQRLLERAIDQDVLKGRFEIVNRYDDKVQIRDYFKVKDVEVSLSGGRVYCEKDETGECIHTGYVLGDPETIRRAQELGIKLRKAETS